MSTYYHTYYGSSYLLSNTNNSGLYSNVDNDNLTKWLKNSYNANISETTDISELLAQLKYNTGFNPYDSIDSYITNLEDNPLGDAINNSDKDYYMYTLSKTTAPMDCVASNVVTGLTAIPAEYSYQNVPVFGTFIYFRSSADSLNAQAILNKTTTEEGLTATYCISESPTTYRIVNLTAQKSDTEYSHGIRLGEGGYITANFNLQNDIDTYYSTGGTMNGIAINTANEAQLVAMYKQLTEELQGLKEYTLTNQEIMDMQAEIDALNGDGVKGNLESKIAEAQNELHEIYAYQLNSITSNTSTGVQGIFNKTTEITAANTIMETVLDQKLFGETGSTYDYVNNPFYKYTVSLRTDSDLEFEKSFNEALPEWNIDNSKITKDTPGGFDPSKYSNIEEKDDKLGPIDILKDLYATQELLALYKQYEDAQNKANSMTLALNTALQNSAEFDFRKLLAAKVLERLMTFNSLATLDLSTEIGIVNNIERGCSTGPSAQKATTTSHVPFDGFYGDINTASATDETALVDPYIVTINGTKYVFGQDKDSNGNIDDVSEILGINDSMDNPFESLISLDSNKDGRVSKEEFLANNIILKALDDSDKLTKISFDTSLISGIDLSKLNNTSSGNIAGSFSMKLANGTTVQGVQTFDDQAYFNNLFSTVVDLTPYQKTSNTSTTSTESETKTEQTPQTTENKTTATENLSHKMLLKQINNAYNALIVDDTSNIETILNNICWKHSISLTSAQRLRIIDTIDPLTPVYEIEKKIINAVSTLNLSA